MTTKMKSRIFVTGANGFVGANIIRMLLENNYEVHILLRTKKTEWRITEIEDKVTIHKGDITNYNTLKKILEDIQPEYIIHLAAHGAYHYQTDLEKIINVNIKGTKNLLEASKEIPYKCFINTGSSSEYGFKNKPMKENDSCDPVSYYAATKLAATKLCKIFAKTNAKPIVTLRLFSVFGPFEEPTRFIPTIMNALLKNETIKLTPGKQRRDFIYVEDICEAYKKTLHLGKSLQGIVCNLGTGDEYTNDEIVKKLFLVANKKTKIQKGTYEKRSWDTTHWVADLSQTKKLLKWKPITSIDEGLQKTYLWYQQKDTLS